MYEADGLGPRLAPNTARPSTDTRPSADGPEHINFAEYQPHIFLPEMALLKTIMIWLNRKRTSVDGGKLWKLLKVLE